MVNYDILTELLDLANLRVTHYQLVSQDELNVFVESRVEAAVCPHCQEVSLSVHEVGEPQMVRDLSIWNRQCYLCYAPRRFKCEECANTVVERVVWREVGLDYTLRYEDDIYERARREPLAQIAHSEGLSEDQVAGLFERGAKKRSPGVATPR